MDITVFVSWYLSSGILEAMNYLKENNNKVSQF